jgi:hypothetical protein
MKDCKEQGVLMLKHFEIFSGDGCVWVSNLAFKQIFTITFKLLWNRPTC